MVETEEKTEVLEKDNDYKNFFIKGFVVLIALISWIVTLFIIFQTESNPLFFIIISVIVTIGLLILFFWTNLSNIFKKEEKEEKVPKPMSEEEMFKKVKDFVESEEIQDHINEYKSMKDYNINNNIIWHFEIMPYLGKKKIHVIINANYPKETPSYLVEPISKYVIAKLINSKSKKPLDDPEVKKTIVENMLTGNIITQEEKKPYKKKEDKKKEDSVV
jgi:energy-coupling factor transporter transmembrane protein EcfT